MSKSGAAIVMFVLKREAHRERPRHQWQNTMLDLLWSALLSMYWAHCLSLKQETKYILIVADYFTKWVEAFPMANQEACTVAEILVREVVCRFGVPLLIHSDQGRNFEFVLFAEMCRLLSIKKTRTTLTIHNQTEWLKDLIALWRHNCRNLLTIIKKIGTNTFLSF